MSNPVTVLSRHCVLACCIGLLLLISTSNSALAQANEVLVEAPPVHKPQISKPSKMPEDMPHFQLAAKINMSQGYVKEAGWLGEDDFLSLVIRPDGAQVLRINYDTLSRDRFISSSFIDERLGGIANADKLRWTISPRKKYVFFYWQDAKSARRWQLLDVSTPPNFRLRNFTPPEGMQIERALFSPDDRYAVFFHDSHIEGSPVSVLVLDLQEGKEEWRIGTSELAFITDAWWSGAIYDTPRFNATAKFYNGEFREQAGLATINIQGHDLNFSENVDGALIGAAGLWGQAIALKGNTQSPYFLLVSQPNDRDQIPLSSVPAKIELLPEPGMVLLANHDGQLVHELWLLDANGGNKYLVDGDAADFALNSSGRLLVRGEQLNELRIYDFVNPRSNTERPPDAWIPH